MKHLLTQKMLFYFLLSIKIIIFKDVQGWKVKLLFTNHRKIEIFGKILKILDLEVTLTFSG